MLFTGVSFSLLTAIRGLSTHITTLHFGVAGNMTVPILEPSLWPPRDFRIWVSASNEVDLLILDESESISFFNGKEPRPLKEYSDLRGNIVIFEIPIRGKYGLLVRNRRETIVDGEVVITIYGFEKDLVLVSILTLTAGAVLLAVGYLTLRMRKTTQEHA